MNRKQSSESDRSSWAEQEDAFFGSDDEKPSAATIIRKKGARILKDSVDTIGKKKNGLMKHLSAITPTTQPAYISKPNRSRPEYPPIRGPTKIPPSVAIAPTPFFQNLSNMTRKLSAHIPCCTVCGTLAPMSYQYHPFFPQQKACSHHASIVKCCACHRFENPHEPFLDLEDVGRKICDACVRTVIVDSPDAAAVWRGVLNFFDGLGMFGDCVSVRSTMAQIPVLIVGHESLNDPSIRGSGHGNGQTRGLCMYEYRSHPLGGTLKDFISSYRGRGRDVLNSVAKRINTANITAVLCLRGLPSDLTGSILAHEGTHAWLKLHPGYDPRGGGVPLQVEEGCCQLLAFLYLRRMDELADAHNGGGGGGDGPSDEKLRQYFRYSIEIDKDVIYGDGFRMAAAAFEKIGSVYLLLEYVAQHLSFPP